MKKAREKLPYEVVDNAVRKGDIQAVLNQGDFDDELMKECRVIRKFHDQACRILITALKNLPNSSNNDPDVQYIKESINSGVTAAETIFDNHGLLQEHISELDLRLNIVPKVQILMNEIHKVIKDKSGEAIGMNAYRITNWSPTLDSKRKPIEFLEALKQLVHLYDTMRRLSPTGTGHSMSDEVKISLLTKAMTECSTGDNHKVICQVGKDLAHGTGSLDMDLKKDFNLAVAWIRDRYTMQVLSKGKNKRQAEIQTEQANLAVEKYKKKQDKQLKKQRQRDSQPETRVCFRCRKAGHVISDCPLPDNRTEEQKADAQKKKIKRLKTAAQKKAAAAKAEAAQSGSDS
jgi:hypothetical protein